MELHRHTTPRVSIPLAGIGIPLQVLVYQLRDQYMLLSSNWHTFGHFSISAWRTMVLQLLCKIYIYIWHAMLNNGGEDDSYMWETRHNTFSVVWFRQASICRRFERLKSVIYLFTCILEKKSECGQKCMQFSILRMSESDCWSEINKVLSSFIFNNLVLFLQVLTQKCSSSSSFFQLSYHVNPPASWQVAIVEVKLPFHCAH